MRGAKVSHPLELLINDEICEIHIAAPDVLGDVGVVFEDGSS